MKRLRDQTETETETETGTEPRRGVAGSRSPRVAIGLVGPNERGGVLEWLDAGLRGGRSGRIEAEYPLALDPRRGSLQILARCDGEFAAHALGSRVDVDVAGVSVAVGLIGLVYTEPRWRGLGVATRCLTRCIAELSDGGCSIVVLWSALDRLYEPLGFRPVGSEWIVSVSESQCLRAVGPSGSRIQISDPVAADWPLLEELYRQNPSPIRRLPGDLQRLASIPDTRLRVIRRNEEPVAYVCEGRGDDLQGFVHEWAGDSEGILYGLADLASRTGRLGCLIGSLREPPVPELVAAGAHCSERPFAWAWVPDPLSLWGTISQGDPVLRNLRLTALADEFEFAGTHGRVRLDRGAVTALLLGPQRPAQITPVLSPREYLAVRRRLPWPFFLSGLDSI
ncbi:MAG: GNAT family N-acetyltransferase [Myxococcota bacterium]|nr:GNAT family N-acetyltransferase [Myxococcota bacterium]